MKPLWFAGSDSIRTVVVGRICSDRTMHERDPTAFVLDLLRIQCDLRRRQLRALAGASVPWRAGEALGEPLERLLRWHPKEDVVLAVPTPALAADSIVVREPDRLTGPPVPSPAFAARLSSPKSGSPAPPPPVMDGTEGDIRAAVLRARQTTRDRLRERACVFFGCSLERLGILAESVREIRRDEATGETDFQVSVLFEQVDEAGTVEAPRDVEAVRLVILPLAVGELLEPVSHASALVVLEERRLTFGVWSREGLTLLRTFPLGSELVCEQVQHALGCSQEETRLLLERADAGNLSPDAFQILTRGFRPVLPLFAAAWSHMSDDLVRQYRPGECFVAGLWPHLTVRLLLRAPFGKACLRPGGVPSILSAGDRSVGTAHGRRERFSWTRRAAQASLLPANVQSLLCQLGEAVVTTVPAPGVSLRPQTLMRASAR